MKKNLSNEHLISIIVPVYNVEKYLKKCIDSVLAQTYDNFEVILIDDGSTDNSGNICDDYVKKSDMIRVFHKQNGGLSSARNRGIEEAKGDYITFIDSDDSIDTSYLEYLYRLIEKYNSKISICPYKTIDGDIINDIGKKYAECNLTIEEALDRMLCDAGFTISACAKLYDKRLFENVRFPEGKLCEDNGTTYKLICNSNTVAYGNVSQYNYYKRDNSIMNSSFNKRKLDLIILTDQMCNDIDNMFPNLKDSTNRRRNYVRFSILRQMSNSKLPTELKVVKKEIIDYLKQNKENIKKNPKSNFRDRTANFFLGMGVKTFNIIWFLQSVFRKLLFSESKIVNFIVFVVLACIYILPSGYINIGFPIDKAIFSVIVIMAYIVMITLKKYKLKKSDIFLISLCLILFIFSKYINFLLFITMLFANIIIRNKKSVSEYLKKSNILYICLAFTIFYSVMNFGLNSRYAYSAILEINQSGLAIFCLALLLMKKNKIVGYISLGFGFLKFSRSYILATCLFLISKIKFVKKVLNYSKCNFFIKKMNYLNITIISNVLLLLLGIIYFVQYKNGNIVSSDTLISKFSLFDLSNFFRFMVNLLIVIIFIKFPSSFLVGISDKFYIQKGKEISEIYNISYKYINPHNLFFSHLKKYGFFAFIELVYVSKIIEKIVNKNNFLIYIGICMYSIILGAGLYSYWLYLSIFLLLTYENQN